MDALRDAVHLPVSTRIGHCRLHVEERWPSLQILASKEEQQPAGRFVLLAKCPSESTYRIATGEHIVLFLFEAFDIWDIYEVNFTSINVRLGVYLDGIIIKPASTVAGKILSHPFSWNDIFEFLALIESSWNFLHIKVHVKHAIQPSLNLIRIVQKTWQYRSLNMDDSILLPTTIYLDLRLLFKNANL